MPHPSPTLLAHITSFAAARYLSEGLFAVRGLILARLLGPFIFGIWTEMRLAMMLLQHVRLGTNEAMLRDFPLAIGRGARAHAKNIRKFVIAFNLLTSIIAAIILIIYFASNSAIIRFGDQRHLWIIWIGIFCLNQIYWFVHCLLQAEKQFHQVSRIAAAFAVVSTACGAIAAHYSGLPGFLGALIFSYIIVLVFAIGGRGYSSVLRPSWDTAIAIKLIKVGFPIMAANALFILLINVDKIAIWSLLPKQELGIYAAQSHISNFIMLAPSAVAMVIFPSIMERLGQTKQPGAIETYLTQPTLLLAYLACPLIGLLYFWLHIPIIWLLPKYVSAILPGQILVLASFFMIISRVPATILISLNRQKRVVVITLLAITATALGNIGLIQAGRGLVGAAIGSSVGFILYAAMVIPSSFRELKIGLKRFIVFQLRICAPFAVSVGAIMLIDNAFSERVQGIGADLFQTATKSLIFLILCGPVFYYVIKRLDFKNLGTSKIRKV